jgi:hypothetical protein
VSDSEREAELRRLAHDVRNALNGVAVNLEVARSRARRGVDVQQIAPFIETAAQQLDVVSSLHKRYTDVATGVALEQGTKSGALVPDAVTDDTHPRS